MIKSVGQKCFAHLCLMLYEIVVLLYSNYGTSHVVTHIVMHWLLNQLMPVSDSILRIYQDSLAINFMLILY